MVWYKSGEVLNPTRTPSTGFKMSYTIKVKSHGIPERMVLAMLCTTDLFQLYKPCHPLIHIRTYVTLI